MSKDNLPNPFHALVSTTDDKISKTSNELLKTDNVPYSKQEQTNVQKTANEVSIIQRILLTTTISSKASNCCIILKDFDEVNLDSIGSILFERILFLDSFNGNPESIINIPSNENSSTTRADPFIYLFESYMRCDSYRNKDNESTIDKIEELICHTYKTLLLQPDILTSEVAIKDLRPFLLNEICYNNPFCSLINKVLSLLESENSKCPDIFIQVLNDASLRLNKCTIRNIDRPMVTVFHFYASSKYLAKLLVTLPPEQLKAIDLRKGRMFQTTPLGSLLSISSIPRNEGDPYELSSDLSNHETSTLSQTIVRNLNWLRKEIHDIFLKILKSSAVLKKLLLKWIEQCIICNQNISQEWNLQQSYFNTGSNFVSHGFMINLCGVMLLISQPICSSNSRDKHNVLKVDPTYCSQSDKKIGYYGADMHKMTPVVPRHEGDVTENIPKEYSFVTSCFFLTHNVLNLCVTVVAHELKTLSQQHRHFQQEMANAQPQIRDRLKDVMTRMASKQIAIVLAFFDDKISADILELCASTCIWMSQVAIYSHEDCQNLIPKLITLDILREKEHNENKLLRNIPECIVENIVTSISLYKRSKKNVLVTCSKEIIDELFTFIACFMGSPNRIHNPHLRAQIAETLGSIISRDDSEGTSFQATNVNSLAGHHLSPNLISALIHVFVSIEMTGSTVAFEEKFNYRRPMYDVIEMMWSLPNLRKEFVKLADYALQHMESAQPPLFLRFVNLLINDAIFLLDEGLSYMVQLKQQVTERENGEWENLNADQLSTRTRNFDHMTLLAEFHNTLATYTIVTIVKLTDEIPLLFVHMTLVDRIAAMLNHFLQQLVGPKSSEFKVRDMEKYKFRPADIVANICVIYHNLHEQDSFVVAVSGDGRSYSPQLFSTAIAVLERTGNFAISTDIRKVEKVVQAAETNHKLDDDLAATAPDEFMDPIMIQIMTDPVLLPSSNVIVDKTTIARHLLSDQSDPFNRQPLTMEEVIPCADLKEKIQQWRIQQCNSTRDKQ